MYSNHIRQDAFQKNIIKSSAGAFKSWSCILRLSRPEKIALIKTELLSLRNEERQGRYLSFAGRLSGSESAFAQWTFNLFGDDPTRDIGERIKK